MNEELKELFNELELVAALLNGVSSMPTERVVAEISRPVNFAACFPCGDWRRYVPLRVIQVWDRLSLESRAVAYAAASDMVSREP